MIVPSLPQIQYDYDRASNRTWRKYGALSGYDELYSYDGLYRLTDQKRAKLNGTQTAITSGTFQQQSGLDSVGWTFLSVDSAVIEWWLEDSTNSDKNVQATGHMIGILKGSATITGTTLAWAPLTASQ